MPILSALNTSRLNNQSTTFYDKINVYKITKSTLITKGMVVPQTQSKQKNGYALISPNNNARSHNPTPMSHTNSSWHHCPVPVPSWGVSPSGSGSTTQHLHTKVVSLGLTNLANIHG